MKNALALVLLYLSSSVTIASAETATLTIQADRVVRKIDRRRLLGTNLGVFHPARDLANADVQRYLRELKPGFLRIPGGSWSDEYYWNGNGVRTGDHVDVSRRKDGIYDINFSGYSPGFRIQGADRRPIDDDFHGDVDVRALHEMVKKQGAQAIVTVNVGTGTPELAAEWVRWANIVQGYNVRYWEIGNELEGSWELGHFLPDGSPMTGEVYARRFVEFAAAMKAVDPTIKVGGPTAASEKGGFTEDLLRLAGDHVDFVSFHTYPVEKHLDSEQGIFEQAFSLSGAMDRFRGWIAKYQPDRKDEIEIAITEWNSKVVEDRDTGDLINGLWTCVFVGEMFRSGVSFATQWDLLTVTETGGHGLFHFEQFDFDQPGVSQAELDRQYAAFAPPGFAKSQLWGLYLWSKCMGDQLVASSLEGSDHAYAMVTRADDRLSVMVVNVSRDETVRIQLNAPGLEWGESGLATTLSQREYTWNHMTHEPLWSHMPTSREFSIKQDLELTVPPFSARVFELPFKGSALKSAGDEKSDAQPSLRLLLPERSPMDLPVEGWVLVGEGGYDAPVLQPARLTVNGPARADREQVRISEAAGRFFLTPEGTGPVAVRATAGSVSIERSLELVEVKERAEVYWRFETDATEWGGSSTFAVRADDLVRPNQQVAAIDLRRAVPEANKDILLLLESMPANLPRERIGGVVFDLSVAPNLACTDKSVGLGVILQSESEHWIPLGAIPLEQVKGRWESFTFRLPDLKYLKAVDKTYALRFQLFQNNARKVPVDGTIYLDNVGFLLR